MKILLCGKCFAMHSFNVADPDSTDHPWTYCDCKQMAARWLNPDAGTVQVLAMVPDHAFIIGMNNRFLTGAVMTIMKHSADDSNWRGLHEEVTKAPGYVFDASHRNCWAAVLRVGETKDVSWHPAQEKLKEGGTVEEALFEPIAIKVNTVTTLAEKLFLTYEDIVALAGHDPMKGVLYSITYHGPTKEGTIYPGKILKVEANLLIHCYYTGNA
jgi:hypothetical protein